MTIQRFDLIYRFDGDRAEMIRRWPSDERRPGEWCKFQDHLDATLAMRDKILSCAKECKRCDGTGVIAQNGEIIDDCPACFDLRELLKP